MKLPVSRMLRYKVIAGALLLVVTFAVFLLQSKEKDSQWIVSTEAESKMEEPQEIQIQESETSNDELSAKEEVTVDLDGEVRNAGVYTLPGGSRVFEALEKAGGLTENADTRNINLAALLTDGTKIYFPSKEEVALEQDFSGAQSGVINLNTANATQLQELPGVGPSTAEKILSYREQNGNFKNVKDLLNVSGIGEKTFAKFEAMICVE